ncbi:hypothetical protein FO519_001954 [Halicephalobus sp. NKZ332]|nr:hypothetical protein FO519_001954 [Halicephalobus sp. NKZ332]
MSDILLITANVGSLFDENTVIRAQWKEEIIAKIVEQKSKFVALHFQETGGKDYKKYSKDVVLVILDLFSQLKKKDFSSLRAYLDIDYERVDEFTALGAIVFVHKDWIEKVKQYRFKSSPGSYESLNFDEVVIEENLFDSTRVRKEKFAKDFWAAIRWGRKGFLHTRWLINERAVDLINIHLFHDESNLELTQNPLLYSQNRKKALDYTIENYSKWKQSNSLEASCLFIFGDFNFRLRTDSFLMKITKDREIHEIEENVKSIEEPPNCISRSFLNNHHEPLKRNLSAIEFRQKEDKLVDDDSSIVLRIEKKKFDYYDPQCFILNWELYREDDTEPTQYDLKELPINFPPTYPWSEDPASSDSYMKTRPPAWCDRVLMNSTAFESISQNPKPSYNCIGLGACMGDHKPVSLSFSLL